MKLSPRLLKLAYLVPRDSILADIGTDHGLLPIYLICTGHIQRAIASDVKEGPLEQAKANVERFGLTDNIELRLGNGLSVLEPSEAEAIVVAGMGGQVIVDILSNDLPVLRKARRVLLQPMTDASLVRRWLYDNGFSIREEELVKEKHFIYEIISADQGQENIDREILFEVGPRLFEKKGPLWLEFIGYKLRVYETIMAELKNSSEAEKIARYVVLIEELKELLEYGRDSS